MRRMHVMLLIGLVGLAPVLAGCADFDMDKLDIFGLNEKKKLPGDRKPVFPEGVPGVSQGIPPEYIKGYQPQPDTPLTQEGPAATADQSSKKTAAVQPTEETKPKPKRKPKPRPPAQPTAQQNQQQTPPQQQAPPQQTPQAQSPWPDQGQSMAPWPAAPAPGTFSR